MIRIRFHGRGGQGVKTASRIVGTAAFMAGYYAQDAPLYGAERRGAPIIAFTRIDRDTILERGLIISPDIVLVADETLLDDPAVRPLSGLREGGIVFVNSSRTPDEITTGHPVSGTVVTLDLTALAMEVMSKPQVSPAVAGVVCRLLGFIEEGVMVRAIEKELSSIGVRSEARGLSLELAVRAFRQSPAPALSSHEAPAAEKEIDRVVAIAYGGPMLGTANIMRGGTTEVRRTGNWRMFKPLVDTEKCKKCNICFVRCPDSCIVLNDSGYPVILYDNCKGCLICHEECPAGAISLEKEGA